jgi:predicted lipoprotein with Yx(FWY)xxD motif
VAKDRDRHHRGQASRSTANKLRARFRCKCHREHHMAYRIATALAAAGTVLLAAASTTGPAAASAAAYHSSPAAVSLAADGATVSLAAISGIPGKALVGSNRHTLYLFEADKNGKSTCTGACAAAWPPDTVTGMPRAGSGVNQALLGTVKRSDGTTQVTYNHHPLYYFAGDASAGTANGQGSTAFGAGWFVVNASGNKISTR